MGKMKSEGPFKTVGFHVAVGAALSVFLLHPVTMAIYWFEFHQGHPTLASMWQFFVHRTYLAFSSGMLLMTAIFAFIGGLLGLGSGIYYLAITRKNRVLDYLERELAQDIGSLVNEGEGETVEFKTSARWDIRSGRINGALEDAIAKTIAGFLNHRGGSLLVGVGDSGNIAGLAHDYATLKRQDRDGFQLFLMTLVKTKLGGPVCPLVHIIFHNVGGKDVCRLVVEPSNQPVYVSANDGKAHYFVRTGNATRELDVQEALQYISRRRLKG